MADNSSVKVAIRVRPLIPQELNKGCKDVIDIVAENEQIILKPYDKAFTFNYVFGPNAEQDELYCRCVLPLLNNLFEGFNVTIFAYGQTGSGKTHSMGTCYSGEENIGVIPRAVNEIFDYARDHFSIDFSISVSFTELYREVLYDLLNNKSREQSTLEIREDPSKGIYIPNLTEISVESAQQVLDILQKGSQSRATASTNMNAQSSRSHSIFTVNIAMQHKINKSENKTAKLHLVDLAGSERPKKTGAQGTTFKEGVDINKGLFVLGNVISALGDEKTQNGFISYRDSNLTRLLKDSLGGNSITLMIACVSPADYNIEETLSTLRYADRAKKIKNKPVVNQDPKTAEINELKKQVKLLQLQVVGQGGSVISSEDINRLKKENGEINLKIKELKVQLSSALLDKTGLHEKLLILQNANDVLNKKLVDLKQQHVEVLSKITEGVIANDMNCIKENIEKLKEIQEHFDVLKEDQLKTEKEIRDHEETFTILVNSVRSSTGSTPKELQEKEQFYSRQMVLNSELQTISRQLLQKEQLARQLALNTRYMVDEQVMYENERKVEALEKEKESLMQQLKTVKHHDQSNKIAEQRRKRVQELEEQLKGLKKKVAEQSRLIKLKEKDEQKVKTLDQEIVAMKTAKVKLLKQIREESERFKTYKQKAEREIARAKQQERKKETEMAKMKVTHEKQKNVLKRKFEEAAALNRRLQNTLMKRKQAQDARFNGKTDKIVSWLKDELEMHGNLEEVRITLSGLLDDRATLQQQLDELNYNPGTLNNSSDIKAIEEDIDLRTVQIQDLQQKLMDSGEEDKTKNRFDNIQTMSEAKVALKTLFEQATAYRIERVKVDREKNELQDTVNELSERLTKEVDMCHALEEKHLEELSAQEKLYQEKIGILLMQIRGIKNEGVSPESEVIQRCQILEEQLQHKNDLCQHQEETINALKQKLADIQKQTLLARTPDSFSNERKRRAAIDKLDVSVEDCDENDPDWRNTPLGKRILNRTHLGPGQLPNTESTFIVPKATKRSSDGGCTCKTNCNTVRCGCKKTKRGCTGACRCSEMVCQNRKMHEVSSSSQDNVYHSADEFKDSSNEDSKKMRLDDEGTSFESCELTKQKIRF